LKLVATTSISEKSSVNAMIPGRDRLTEFRLPGTARYRPYNLLFSQCF
jgi:hypothetical protein